VWNHRAMRYGIVEGEPGIFPEPIARLFRAIGRLFGRGHRSDPAPGPGPGPGPTEDAGPMDVSDLDPKRPDSRPEKP
jgi:hypothetical protein